MKPVTVRGVTYRSISEAWRTVSPEGLPEVTVRKRLREGWPSTAAFLTLPVDPTLRRVWKDIRTEKSER